MDTLIHESVPPEARGRVFSSREWLMHLAFALCALVIGQLTRVVAPPKILFSIGVLVVAAGIAGLFAARAATRKQANLPGRADD